MDNFLIPVYLGKSTSVASGKYKGLDSYFFYAIKDGRGRFVKYSNYPYWAAASNLPDFLVLEDAPEIVVNEVKSFVEGRVSFEVVPKTRGRSEKVLRKEVSYNQENGVNNVTINIDRSQSNTLTDTTSTISGSFLLKPLKQETTDFSAGHGVSSPPKSNKDSNIKAKRNLSKTGTESQSSSLPGLSSDGHAGISRGYEGTGLGQCKTTSEPRTRRVPGEGILGNGGGDPGGVHGLPTSNESSNSVIDGSGVSRVLKSKRVRRTNAELASGRSLEEIRASREG